MTKLTLIPDDDKRLRMKSKPFNVRNPRFEFEPWNKSISLDEVVAEMFTLMKDNNGMGLAAPQVGIAKRFFIMSYDGQDYTCCNPSLISASVRSESAIEGCLSFPGVRVRVDRSESVKVKYTTPGGIKRTRTFRGTLARCWLHELDHLNGIVFTERGEIVTPE